MPIFPHYSIYFYHYQSGYWCLSWFFFFIIFKSTWLKKGAPHLFLIIYEFWFDNYYVFLITKLGFWDEDILIWFNWVWLFRMKWGVFSLIIFEIMVMVMVWDWVLFCFCLLCFVLLCFVFIRLRLSSILA